MERAAIWDLVIEDMRQRDRLGEQMYGVRLTANNGRDALQDAYEEALDLAVYLRQVIEERRNGTCVTCSMRVRLSVERDGQPKRIQDPETGEWFGGNSPRPPRKPTPEELAEIERTGSVFGIKR